MTREHKFLGGNRGDLYVKEFRGDSTPPVREKTRVDTRDKRRETTRELRRAQVAHPVWPAHRPRRSPGETSVWGPLCSLIEQEEREDSSCQICHRVWNKRKDGGEDKAARTE